MPSVLGLVPLLGREPLALEPFGAGPLFLAAVQALYDAVSGPVYVVTTPGVGRLSALHRSVNPSAYVAVSVADARDLLKTAQAAQQSVLIHDPLCPIVSTSFLNELSARAENGEAVVAVRRVVDTIKSTADGAISATVDREAVRVVSSPVAAPAQRILSLGDLDTVLRGHDVLVQALRKTGGVSFVGAPAAGRRVEDMSALDLIAAFDAVGHRLRER